MAVDVDQFEQWWNGRSRADIEAIVVALEASSATADGAVCRIRASRDIEISLRRTGRLRLGCDAAHRATLAALRACAETGVSAVDRSGTTRLARAAGDAARGLVVGDACESTETLLRPFFGGTVFSPV